VLLLRHPLATLLDDRTHEVLPDFSRPGVQGSRAYLAACGRRRDGERLPFYPAAVIGRYVALAICAALCAACGGTAAGGATGTLPPTVAATTPASPAPQPSTAAPTTTPPGSVAATPSTAAPTSPAGRPTLPQSTEPAPPGAQAFPATEQGALDLVRAVYAASERAVTTGHSNEYRSLVASYCNCLQLAKEVDARAARGEKVIGGLRAGTRFSNVVVTGDFGTVSVFYRLQAGEVRSAAGKVVLVSPARGQFQDAVTLERRGAAWLLTRISALTTGKPVR